MADDATRTVAADLGRPDALCALLVSRGVPPAADAGSLVRAAAEPRHKLSVTLLSALRSAGMPLTSPQQAELEDHQRRIEHYRQTWPVISAAAPDAYVVKGTAISARYPAGLVRAAGDMDVICPADQLWSAASALVRLGWQVGALTVLPGPAFAMPVDAPVRIGPATGPQVLLELTQPSDSPRIDEAYAVELRTVEVATSFRVETQHDVARRSAVAANVLALVAERWERPFRSRDVYDLAVLAAELDPVERANVRAALSEVALWPEMRELVRLLRRSGLRTDFDVGASRGLAWRDRTVRVARAVRRYAHPVRVLGYLGMSTVERDRGRLLDRISRWVYERVGVRRLLAVGLPAFGVPLPVEPEPPYAEDGMWLLPRGRHLVAVTPVGSFLMVTGPCLDSWLAEAAAPRPASPEPPDAPVAEAGQAATHG